MVHDEHFPQAPGMVGWRCVGLTDGGTLGEEEHRLAVDESLPGRITAHGGDVKHGFEEFSLPVSAVSEDLGSQRAVISPTVIGRAVISVT